MIFQIENFMLDLTKSNKAKLYKESNLKFMGDGYRAITMLINSVKDPQPVKDKFKAQLSMREKPKFSNGDDLEQLKQDLLEEERARSQKRKK